MGQLTNYMVTGCIWTFTSTNFTLTLPYGIATNFSEFQSVNNSGVYTIQDDLTDFTATHRTEAWTSTGSIGSYNGFFNDLSESSDVYCYPFGINNSGTVVGSTSGNGAVLTAFVWNGEGEPVSLGAAGGQTGYSAAYDVNSAGSAVGFQITASAGPLFLWTPTTNNGTSGTLTDISPTNTWNGEARGINDSGIVVGWAEIWDQNSCNPSVHQAIIYDAVNGARDLNTLIPGETGWHLLGALSINNGGYIVGLGDLTTYDESCPPIPTTERRAFLLIPNP